VGFVVFLFGGGFGGFGLVWWGWGGGLGFLGFGFGGRKGLGPLVRSVALKYGGHAEVETISGYQI